MATVRCPVCEKPFDPAGATAMPFCSERCRTIDLGRWLGEEYRMPIERRDAPDADAVDHED